MAKISGLPILATSAIALGIIWLATAMEAKTPQDRPSEARARVDPALTRFLSSVGAGDARSQQQEMQAINDYLPPGMDMFKHFVRTGDSDFLASARFDQFERCSACREYLLSQVSEIARSAQSTKTLLNWLAKTASPDNLDFLVKVGASLESVSPGSTSEALEIRSVAPGLSNMESHQLLSLMALPNPPAWFFDSVTQRTKEDPKFANLVVESLKNARSDLERLRLVGTMSGSQLREILEDQFFAGDRDVRKAILSLIKENTSVDNVETMIVVFRTENPEASRQLGKAWAEGNLSGERLDQLETMLGAPTITTNDRQAISFLLKNAEDHQRAEEIISRYQLYN